MIYVFPSFESREKDIKKIKGISRLFAYPRVPNFENEGKIVILDSGAYGLSLRKEKMNDMHMQNLSKHYEKHCKKNVLCIAPDEFLNPYQSMENFFKWHSKKYFKNIVPVLQCSKKYEINTKELIDQIKFYQKYKPKAYCFSNNYLTADIAVNSDLTKIIKFLKLKLGISWVHNLGAGWSLEDIRKWEQIGFDSMDSIAYYSTKNKNEFGSLDAVENIRNILKITKGD